MLAFKIHKNTGLKYLKRQFGYYIFKEIINSHVYCLNISLNNYMRTFLRNIESGIPYDRSHRAFTLSFGYETTL